jgi:hypothetical protein
MYMDYAVSEIIDLIHTWIQFLVFATSAVIAAQRSFRNPKDWMNRLLSGAFLCLSLSDLLWDLYQSVLHDYPMGFTASDMSWLGFYCFLIVINFTLMSKWLPADRHAARRIFLPSLIAPVLALLFHASYYLLHGSFYINLIYCIAFTPLAYTTFCQFLASGGKAGVQAGLHRYHAMVLLFITAEQLMYLLSALDLYDASILLDMVLTVSALLIVRAAKGGAER